jgi:ABC-type multidrug transport system fused ATPase/permease subunit
LSAVDVRVGKKIYKNCIKGYLSGKTVLLVTHSLQYIKNDDRVVLMENGKIISDANYSDLKSESTFMFKENILEKEIEDEEEEIVVEEGNKKEDGKLIVEEVRKDGSVSSKIFYEYFKSFGYFLIFLFLFFGLLSKSMEITSNVFLGIDNLKIYYYILITISMIFQIFMSLSINFGNLNSSVSFHNKMLNSILKTKISFFEQNPTGRILNRFSKDVHVMDNDPPFLIFSIFNHLSNILISFTLIFIATPPSLIILSISF